MVEFVGSVDVIEEPLVVNGEVLVPLADPLAPVSACVALVPIDELLEREPVGSVDSLRTGNCSPVPESGVSFAFGLRQSFSFASVHLPVLSAAFAIGEVDRKPANKVVSTSK